MKAHVLNYKITRTYPGSSGSWSEPAEPPTAEVSITRIEIEPDERASVGDEFQIEGKLQYDFEFEDLFCEVLGIESEREGWQKLLVNAGGTITTGPTPPQSQRGRG